MPTRNLSIMFTDIKGFTARTNQETRQGLVNLLKKHDRLLLPVIRYFDGHVIKTIGDAFLVRFESATDAVLCGLAIQEVLRQFNATAAKEEERLKVRVAINTGDVELKDGDVLGEAVNIASRLEGATEAGEVYFTEAVYLAMNRTEVPSAEVGEKIFQGIAQPIRVYRVVQDPTSDQARRLAQCVRLLPSGPVIHGYREKAAASRSGWMWAAGGALAALIAVVVFLRFGPREPVPEPLWARPAKLLEAGESLEALNAVHDALLKEPGDAKLRDIALTAATQYADFLEKERSPGDALAWLRGQLDQKRYLAPLEDRLQLLDARVSMADAMQNRRASQDVTMHAWELARKYPKNAAVPYEMGLLLRKRYIVEVIVPLFEEALERGMPANEEMFKACTESLSRNGPEDSNSNQAHDLLRTHFAKERLVWAEQALREGQGLDVLNAWKIVREERHALAQDDGYLKLILAASGQGDKESIEALLSKGEPARRTQAAAVLKAALEEKLIPMPHDAAVQDALLKYGPPPEAPKEGM